MKINWRVVIGILISLVALWLITKDVNPDQFANALVQANYWWALPSTVFILFSIWVRGYRWRALLDNRITLVRSFNINNIGSLLNNILPMRLGDVARAYFVSRNREVAAMECFSTVVVEKLLDVLTVFGFLIVALSFFSADEVFARTGAIAAAIAFFAVVLLFIMARWREQVVVLAQKLLSWLPRSLRHAIIHHGDQFLLGIQSIKTKNLIIAIVLSIVVWIGWSMGCWLLLQAFVPNSTWYSGVFVTCAIALGLTIPSAPSGAGLFEAATVAALALFDIPADIALAYAVLLHLWVFVITTILGVYGLNAEGQNFSSAAAATQRMLDAQKQNLSGDGQQL